MSEIETRKTHRLGEARKFIVHAMSMRQPVMLWGPPGIGKSELVAGIVDEWSATAANEGGKPSLLVDVRLPLWEPTDIKGIPYFNPELGTMVWAAPSELPSEELASNYDKVVLFLDELNGAAPSVQAAAYQLVLNRRVGEYRLPDNVMVVAAGNRESDKGVTYKMPKPLANRLMHFEVRAEFDDWCDWATDNGVSADIVGYLTYRKGDLNKFDPKSSDRSFPTPRSWVMVDRMLKGDLSAFTDSEITDMVIGAIGEGTALQFAAYRKVASQLPNPTDILTGKVTEVKTTEMSAMYSLATSLSYELKAADDARERGDIDRDELNSMINNAIGFWLAHFQDEMVIMSFRLILRYKLKIQIEKLSNWKPFYTRFGDLIHAV